MISPILLATSPLLLVISSAFTRDSRLFARAVKRAFLRELLVCRYFYVAGDQNENELILSSVLTAFYETMDAMLR